MPKMHRGVLAGVFGAAVAAAVIGVQAAPQTGTVKVTEEQFGSEISVRRGQLISLTLTENPSTGYRLLHMTAGDEPFRLESRVYKPGGNNPGSPGKTTFTFRTTKAGKGQLMFVTGQTWNLKESLKDVEPWTATVVVK